MWGINGRKTGAPPTTGGRTPVAAIRTANRLRKNCKPTALKLHSDCSTTAHPTFFKSETEVVKLAIALHRAQSQSVPDGFAKYFCDQQSVDFKEENRPVNFRRTGHLQFVGTHAAIAQS